MHILERLSSYNIWIGFPIYYFMIRTPVMGEAIPISLPLR